MACSSQLPKIATMSYQSAIEVPVPTVEDVGVKFNEFFPVGQQTFKSYDEFAKRWAEFQRSSGTSYSVDQSLTRERHFKQSGVKIPEAVRYKSILFACIHGKRKTTKPEIRKR